MAPAPTDTPPPSMFVGVGGLCVGMEGSVRSMWRSVGVLLFSVIFFAVLCAPTVAMFLCNIKRGCGWMCFSAGSFPSDQGRSGTAGFNLRQRKTRKGIPMDERRRNRVNYGAGQSVTISYTPVMSCKKGTQLGRGSTNGIPF